MPVTRSTDFTYRSSTDFIVVHCSATKPSQDIGADEIDAIHRGFGWNGIGYHGVIRRNGAREDGRYIEAVGAHCKSHNRVSVGICLVGGVDDDGHPVCNFTFDQFVTLHAWLDELAGPHGRYPHAEIVGHRDLSPDLDGDGEIGHHEWMKHCPCFDVRGFMSQL